MKASTGFKLDHVAIVVSDIDWYERCLVEVFGMEVSRRKNSAGVQEQIWLDGGIQLVGGDRITAESQRMAHLALAGTLSEEESEKLVSMGARRLPKGQHWWEFPDGLRLELIK